MSRTASYCGSSDESPAEQDDYCGARKKHTTAQPAIDITTLGAGQKAPVHTSSRMLAELLSDDLTRPGAAAECDSSAVAAKTPLHEDLFGASARAARRIGEVAQVPADSESWSRSLEEEDYGADDKDDDGTNDDLGWLVPFDSVEPIFIEGAGANHLKLWTLQGRLCIENDLGHQVYMENIFAQQQGPFAGRGLDSNYSSGPDVPYAIHCTGYD